MKRLSFMNWGGDKGRCCNWKIWEPIIFSDERREHRNQGL